MSTNTPPAATCGTTLPEFQPARDAVLLIDYFAAKVMQAYLATDEIAQAGDYIRLATKSYSMAQAMIEQREIRLDAMRHVEELSKPKTPNQTPLDGLPKPSSGEAQGKK